MSRITGLAALLAAIIGSFSLLIAPVVNADPGSWYGRAWIGGDYYSQSYFDNEGKDYTPIDYYQCYTGQSDPSVIPKVQPGGVAVPANVESVSSFIGWLQSMYYTGTSGCVGQWERTGAAFIVDTMLGMNGGASRYISGEEWTDLTNRMNAVAGGIQWNLYQSGTPENSQSMYDRGNIDISGIHSGNTWEGFQTIVVPAAGGGSYQLFRSCANPFGSLSGLQPAPQDYTLSTSTPTTSGPAESGSQVTVNPSVTNSGHAPSQNTQWQFSQFTVSPGGTYPNGGTSGEAPAQYYGNNLKRLDGGGGRSFPVGVTGVDSGAQTLPDEPVGTKVCWALSVQPYTNTNNSNAWYHSTPFCVTIAKKPKVQVLGGDLSVGDGFTGGAGATSNITTSVTVKSGTSYGSWDEYGVSATGTVVGFGSGSAYNNGLVGATSCDVSQLIFTNAGVGGCTSGTSLGHYTSTQSIPNVAQAFPATASLGNNTINNIASVANNTSQSASGTVTINGGTLNKGQWLVLNAPSATVNITSNVTYTDDTLNSIDDIPQLIIIANCVNISGSVTDVDAWIITQGEAGSSCDGVTGGGVLNTCSDVAIGAALSSSICSNALQINGPVMASHLYLQRTAGAGTGNDTGDPAEVFNLRPDAYLWLLQRSASSGFVQAMQTTQLPPRF